MKTTLGLTAISLLLAVFNLSAETHYVSLNSVNPTPPYTNWATAATSIQDAIDAAVASDIILVTNGVYQIGGRLAYFGAPTNRVVVNKPVTVQSVNGPAVTVILGHQVPVTTNGPSAVRCAYLTNGAALVGFTLTNGATATSGLEPSVSGGGVCCASPSATVSGLVSNCVVTGNTAYQLGGGIYKGTLYNCTLIGNLAGAGGGAVYGATLAGCALTGNVARGGGGAYNSTLTECTLNGNFTLQLGLGGGVSGCALTDCTLTGNVSNNGLGGGAYGSFLTNCTLSGNSALGPGLPVGGGGASSSTLNNCTLSGNSAILGGGAYGATLIRCAIIGNLALTNSQFNTGQGGGIWGDLVYNPCKVSNCMIISNSAARWGGGAYQALLTNCTLSANSALFGGGAYGGALNNCTVTGNSAIPDARGFGGYGGGIFSSAVLRNCIIYFNSAASAANYDPNSFLANCCTTPLSPSYPSLIALDPQLADFSHLSAGSPCIGAGNAFSAFGTDIDGEKWLNPPSIGCDEYHPGTATGPLTVSVSAIYSSVAVGFAIPFTAQIQGHASANQWDFGDGTVVSNQPYASHAWAALGDYTVVLRAFNDDNLAGVSASLTIHVVPSPIHYVDANGVNPVAPYSSWATAATNIQDAVDAASIPGASVLVTNGVYASGGRAVNGSMTNRVAVNKLLGLQSVNGPEFTIIQGHQVTGTTNGDGAVRCVYLADGAALVGFTLTNGATRAVGDQYLEGSGGGAWCASTNSLVSNCVVTGNSARYSGGGVYGGTLYNCTLGGNSTPGSGAGAFASSLNNCTLTGNAGYMTSEGGTLHNCTLNDNSGFGAADGTLYNCTLSGNGRGGATNSTLYNCTLTANAHYGSLRGRLYNCSLTGNNGFGAAGGTLYNCALSGNFGFGAADGALYNCTLTGNAGGGVLNATLYNCIVYFNTIAGGTNYDASSFLTNCCTTPLPPGAGNITLDPQLADSYHLSAGSPCIGAGSSAYTQGTDIDCEPWENPPSIGCDEYHPGTATGPLTVSLSASYTTVAVGFAIQFTAQIQGRTAASRWEFGDGTVVSNQPYVSHAWVLPGDHTVVLRAFNDDHPAGVSASLTIHAVPQPVHYVAADGLNPVPPYSSWATAATNIQDGVDAASIPGELVLVTNGVYASGGRAVYGLMTNRVAVDKLLTLQSVNGPEFTIIQGYQVPGTTNGDGAVRCVYLTNDATLVGFTLTNGATRSGADPLHEELGGGVWCESTSAVVSNCLVAGNSAADYGGGAYGGTFYNCTFIGNSAYFGGGAYGGTLNNSTLSGNSGAGAGGAFVCALYNCTLSGNSAAFYSGGGAGGGILYNCTLSGNFASQGGGASGSTLYNCTVYFNSAPAGAGGGVYGCTLYNCTLTGNAGGGAVAATLYNSIVYFNSVSSGANYDPACTLTNCCTTPLPSGAGNIALDPQLADSYHLSAGSPCIGAGSAAYALGTDIDGEAWGIPPSIGCDEYHLGTATGPLTVSLLANYTNVAAGYAIQFTAQIQGRTSASRWEFGDGTVVSNQPYASHAWVLPGDYTVVSRAFNDDHPAGVSASLIIHVVAQPIHYVAANSLNPVEPYSSWDTAATNVQDAVDTVSLPGALVLVTNGVYASGGRAVYGLMTNRVVVDRPLTLQSVNGPEFTIIRGYQVPHSINGDGAVRCVYLTNDATLSGFTLTNGATRTSGDPVLEESGGGVWCESTSVVVTNCVVAGNQAASEGGGAFAGTLRNCTLTGNSAGVGGGASRGTLYNSTLTSGWASFAGGGAFAGPLYSCTLSDNSAGNLGGGESDCTLYNCTLTGNSAVSGGGASGGTLYNCTLSGNSAGVSKGGGAEDCALINCTLSGNAGGGAVGALLYNCIVRFNSAAGGTDYDSSCTLDYCCTTPLPPGTGNIALDPRFVDAASGNLRLQSNSPCINAGLNAYASGPTDLDGLPRISGGTVDIGAYEYQSPSSIISYAWLQEYGLPTDGSADLADTDGDGMNNYQEWVAGTDPTSALSALRIVAITKGTPGLVVTWQSVPTRSYWVERTASISPLAFSLVGNNLAGDPASTNSFQDLSATKPVPYFYRVGVHPQ